MLTLDNVAALPLAAAAFDRDHTLIAKTPEWEGMSPGTLTYAYGAASIAVAPWTYDASGLVVANRLIDEIKQTMEHVDGVEWKRLAMHVAGLRLLTGDIPDDEGTTTDATDYLTAALPVRVAIPVRIVADTEYPLVAPAVVALAVLQLVVNAENHAHAAGVVVAVEPGPRFSVRWPVDSDFSSRPITTSRRRSLRERLGLGYDRLVADALGGQLTGILDLGPGEAGTMLALGQRPLTLPLAKVRDNRIVEATRSWYEESNLSVGSSLSAPLVALVTRAHEQPGAIVRDTDGWAARAAKGWSWIAQEPNDIVARCHDALHLLDHEKTLFRAPQPFATRLQALASLLSVSLGNPLPMVSGRVWNDEIGDVCQRLGVTIPIPHFRGPSVLEPTLSGYLIAEYGDEVVAQGDALMVRMVPTKSVDLPIRSLMADGESAFFLTPRE